MGDIFVVIYKFVTPKERLQHIFKPPDPDLLGNMDIGRFSTDPNFRLKNTRSSSRLIRFQSIFVGYNCKEARQEMW